MAYANQYSHADIGRITLMIAEGKTYREIGEALGRSRAAIAGLCANLGIPSRAEAGTHNATIKPRWKRPYTEDELNRLRELAGLGLSRDAIAAALERSRGSINGTCSYYGIKTNGGPGGTPSHRVPMQTPILQPGQ